MAGGGPLLDLQGKQQVKAQQASELKGQPRGGRGMRRALSAVLAWFRALTRLMLSWARVADGLGAVFVGREEAGFLHKIAGEGEVALGQLLVQGLVGQQPEPDQTRPVRTRGPRRRRASG